MITALVLSLCSLTVSIPEREANGLPHLRSESVLVRFADTGEVLLDKNANKVRPIASVTKLLSALVLSRKQAAPPEWITIEEHDKDRLKWSRSRLKIGSVYRSEDLYRAALIASDNRAIYALVRASGFDRAAFVEEMNRTAHELGMASSRFRDPAGIDPGNVSSANDLVKLLDAIAEDQRAIETCQQDFVSLISADERTLKLTNTNRLARSSRWSVLIGKTGYTVEAGRALAVRVTIEGRPVDMVFLGAREFASIFGDAGRVRRWMIEKRST